MIPKTAYIDINLKIDINNFLYDEDKKAMLEDDDQDAIEEYIKEEIGKYINSNLEADSFSKISDLFIDLI